jgi:hypothetical protein
MDWVFAERWPSEEVPPWGFGTAGGHAAEHEAS